MFSFQTSHHTEDDELTSSNVKNICECIGMYEHLINRWTISVNFAKKKLLELYNDVWRAEQQKTPKLINYAVIKESI